MSRQLPLDLRPRTAFGREDFFVSPGNALALAALDAPQDWPGGKLVLLGPEGSGKSHLAAIWAAEHGAERLPSAELWTRDPARPPAALVVEDADRIAGARAQEEALFHLHNAVLARGGRLLVTAAAPPRDWGLLLPDLVSRLQAAGTVRLEAPDDALLGAVLVKLFADRQLAVPPALIPWLIGRMDRSLAAARRLVAALDAAALAEGRAVSRVLAAQVMDTLP